MSFIKPDFDNPYADRSVREKYYEGVEHYDRASRNELYHTTKYLYETPPHSVPQAKIYEILAKKNEFKKFENVAVCKEEYQEYRRLSRLLQETLPWAAGRVPKSTLPYVSDYIPQIDDFKKVLSQPLKAKLDEFQFNAGAHIEMPPELRTQLEEDFAKCYPVFATLGKKRAGPFYEVSNTGNDKVYAHKDFPLVFRVASKEAVEFELKRNADLQKFVQEKNLNYIRVPQSAFLDFKPDATKKIYVEQRIQRLLPERKTAAFWNNLISHYIKEGTLEFKQNLCTVVRQMAALTGKFSYPALGSDRMSALYVADQAPAIYATCIYSGNTIFGQQHTESQRRYAIEDFVDTFPLTSILNASVVIECPDYPIPPNIMDRFRGVKLYRTLQNWSEPSIPLNQFSIVATAPQTTVKTHGTFAPKVTEIRVSCELARNHTLTIRGQGAGLDWNNGIPLKREKDNTYVYRFEGPSSDIRFKILLDDTQWESGNDHVVEIGKSTEVVPLLVLPKPTTLISVNGGPTDKFHIRGQGGGLSWNKGMEMKYANGKWTYETDAKFEKLAYKILKNDEVWEQGNDHTSLYNTEATVSPKF